MNKKEFDTQLALAETQAAELAATLNNLNSGLDDQGLSPLKVEYDDGIKVTNDGYQDDTSTIDCQWVD